MAFVWKKRNSKYWQAGFYDRDGKRKNRSTKLPNKPGYRKEAQRIAEQYEEAAMRVRSARQMRTVIMDLHKEITREELEVVSLKSSLEGWLSKKKLEVSSNSYAKYSQLVKSFLKFMGESQDEDINEVSRKDVTDFRNKLAGKLAATTVNTKIKVLRSAFKDAERDNHLIENPAKYVERVKDDGEKFEKQPFKLDELRLVLSKADDEWKSMILFGLYTGQRLGDIIKLRWSNLNLSDETINIKTGKTKTRLSIPMASPLLKHIMGLPTRSTPEALLHPRAHDLVARAKGRTSTCSNQFTRLLEQCGLREKTTHQGRGIGRDTKREAHQLSFHSLRHTAVSFMHAANIPPATVQALIGHDSDAVHQIYVHTDKEAQKRATEALPDLLG